MIKPDEKALLVVVAEKPEHAFVRFLIQYLHHTRRMHRKRAWFLLGKWTGDWYEYGVNLELGWLTADGRANAAEWGAVPTLPVPRLLPDFRKSLATAMHSAREREQETVEEPPDWLSAAAVRFDAIVAQETPHVSSE